MDEHPFADQAQPKTSADCDFIVVLSSNCDRNKLKISRGLEFGQMAIVVKKKGPLSQVNPLFS